MDSKAQRITATAAALVAMGLAAKLVHKSLSKKKNIAGQRRSLDQLVRENIKKLAPYRCARDDYTEGILMDANENPFGPPVVDLNETQKAMELNRYPTPYMLPLKEAIVKYRGHIKPSNIFVGVGSDEAIDLLMRIFCIPQQDSIMICPPTYGMYSVCANTNDVNIQVAPLTTAFDIDLDKILDVCDETTKMVWVCSPGNPTSHAIPHADVEKLCTAFQYGIVVIDEAYVDFSSEGTAIPLLKKYPNLVILQTLSKGFGLAGIRLGMAFGSPDVIQYMNNVKAPYSINKLTENVAVRAFKDMTLYNKNIKTCLDERDRVATALKAFNFVTKVHPSDTNFVLFQIPRFAHECYKNMATQGVVTRYRGNCMHCTDCLRVSIGIPSENDSFLKLLPLVYADVSKK